MPTVVQNVTPNTNQENVSPSVSLENVRKAACNAMAEHIDGTAKESRKRVGQERAARSAPHDEVATSQDTAAVAWTRALRRDEDGPAFSDLRCMRLRFV